MSPTAKTNLALTLLLTVLLVIALLGRQQAPASILPGLSGQQVAQIHIQMGNGNWRFNRHAGGWQGDIDNIDGRILDDLSMLADAVSLRSFAAARADRRELGLQPAQARLSLNGQALSFGATEPIDGYRYLLIGERVYLIEDRFWPLLLKIRQAAGNAEKK